MRITEHDLNRLIERLNEFTCSPTVTYSKDDEGKLRANLDNYHLSWAYGGVALHRITNGSGGVRDVLNSGYTTKRDLYNRIQAYLAGLSE